MLLGSFHHQNSVEILSHSAIGSEIAKNTVTNNYLSDWQKSLKQQELVECQGRLRCEIQTRLYWLAVDTGQDVSFGAGMVASIPEGVLDTFKE